MQLILKLLCILWNSCVPKYIYKDIKGISVSWFYISLSNSKWQMVKMPELVNSPGKVCTCTCIVKQHDLDNALLTISKYLLCAIQILRIRLLGVQMNLCIYSGRMCQRQSHVVP